ncbi:MAG: YkgJ family cysteine cluster protein [Deltaproteobacteria bacterium]|nr:MAG: YkgJ family cysteine cluster protein [Deltaproteobacteria bacterium]
MTERPQSGAPKAWYGAGLRFGCTSCGACCTGDPGAVWVSALEIARLADHLGVSLGEMDRRYLRLRGIRKALYERFNGDCIFYDREGGGCRVYSARPVQCRTWPFWEPLVETRRAWQVVCEACPGCGQGELVSQEIIVRHQALLAKAREGAGPE